MRVKAENSYPLSPMQEGMLFNFLVDRQSGVDVEQIVCSLHEPVDPALFQKAWEKVVARHPILRTSFEWEEVAEPIQVVHPEGAVPFEELDWRSRSPGEQEEGLISYLESDRHRGFLLQELPLMRIALFRLGEEEYRCVWTFHHALLDGRSFPLVLKEVFSFYEAFCQGRDISMDLPRPFGDYIAWLQGKDHYQSGTFWREMLKGFTGPTPFNVSRDPHPGSGAKNHGARELRLSREVTENLNSFTRENGLTLNTLIQGAWSLLLHHYSGEEDLVFGATRACRRSAVDGAESMVGIFINTLPVRVQVSSDMMLIPFLKGLRTQQVGLREYEHTPLHLVQGWSEVPRGKPLFESIVVFENYLLNTTMRAEGGHWLNREFQYLGQTNFPVTLIGYADAELVLRIEYDRHRFEPSTIERMLGHLETLLSGMSEDPNRPVEELPLLGQEELTELIQGFNRPAALPNRPQCPEDGRATLNGLFEAQVALRPDAVALTCDGESLTYAQLNAQANRLARELVKCGVKPDTLVGLCVDRSNELVIALVAILKAGGAYLPIDLAYPADRLAFMLEDAQAPVLLTQSKLTGNLPTTQAKVVCVDEVLARLTQAGEEANLPPVAGPDHLAYVIYTSGTTGKPKGSLITHRNVARLFAATESWYQFNDRDVWTLFHSSAFDFSVWEIWGALLYGGRVVVVPFLVSRSPDAFYDLLASERVTVLNQTPSAFRQLIQAEESVGQKELALRYVIFGGEALEMQSLRPWFERHGDQRPLLVNMYGITETTVHVTYRPLSQDDLNSGSVIGVPIPDLQIYILDKQQRPVPIGVPGEMYVGGGGLARGYLNRPELTAERFIPDQFTNRPGSRLYKTGDLARFLPNRDIEYLGRIDDQVKIRGFRIELGEIESVLCQHPAVRQASVMAREDVPGTKRLVAYLVTTSPTPEVSTLREHLKKKMPEYMVPAAFVFMEKLPLNNNGKIDRKALPVPEEQRPELGGRYVAPRTPVEEKLAAIWSKSLRVEKVGVHDNFFELGGDSILSIQIISSARREGLKLTPEVLFAHPTIAELAAVAGVAQELQTIEEVVAGDVPLTPIQHWFFEQNLEEWQHYNQAFMFEVVERLDRSLLESALQELSRHHDALRLRYIREGQGWRQFYSTSAEPAPLCWTNLAALGEHEQQQQIESVAASTQASLNLQTGPLWRVAYFDLGSGRPARLLLVVHHLAVDGISWRPVVEDLETAYQQLHAGQAVQLPPKTTSFKRWAERLREYARTESLENELPYWRAVTDPQRVAEAVKSWARHEASAENTEGSSSILRVSLTADETQALLQQVPPVYNTQVNDVLLTALLRAWNRWSGSAVLFANIEGHGRETLFEHTDLSRTVGWFTSIFPVRLELPGHKDDGEPDKTLMMVKEQLRQIPRRGIGYGLLRYLSVNAGLMERSEPLLLFNYLGQFDQLLAGSKLFRFAGESTGPWHSPQQRRRHVLEVNGRVIGGRLELEWTYNPKFHPEASVGQLAHEFLAALKELIAHCQLPHAGGRTPSDFPLAHLDQSTLDQWMTGWRNIEDMYPLSPIQTLFYSANPGAVQSAFDQWHCTLRGELDVAAFQNAWHETLRRHTILRSTIHSEGLREPLQVVHRDVRLPWTVEDWRSSPSPQHAGRWSAFLKQDRAQPLQLTEAPAMRFALARLTETTWKFLWTVPALLLDGWSWPVVFRDASRLYEALSHHASPQLEPARPYRSYLEWLGKQSREESEKFWRESLAGFREPTLLRGEVPEEYVGSEGYLEHAIQLSTGATQALLSAARQRQVTLNTLVEGAWALLLSRQSGSTEVVFGAAFSGRPADLPGVESIVGPFVNNLPVRVAVDHGATAGEFFKQLHARLLKLNPYQYTPLMEIQRSSEVPWRHRLFDSVLVFQNYLVDESARRLGGQIEIAEFAGPIHTNYPLMLLVEPGAALRLTLTYDRQRLARTTVERWGRDLSILLDEIPRGFDKTTGELESLLSPAPVRPVKAQRKLRAESQNFVPPQTGMEVAIARVWQKMFGLEKVSIEENLFDLGGHSLLLVEMHHQLRETLKAEFPIVTLFEHPTVRSLARHLSQPATAAPRAGEQWRDRAQRQRQALAQMRTTLKK